VAAASGETTAKFAPATKAAAKAAHQALADTRRAAKSGAARKQEVGLERKCFLSLQFREKMRNLVHNWRAFVDAKYFAKMSAFPRKCSIFVKNRKKFVFFVVQFLKIINWRYKAKEVAKTFYQPNNYTKS
jgi:hypothetical protein